MTVHADLFCRVVDNYGDIGVCWRLARRLAHGLRWQVRLWVDDLRSFARIQPGIDPDAARQRHARIEIIHWRETPPSPLPQPGDVVIEAFAYAMDRSTDSWRNLAEQIPAEKRLATIVESYLTPVHRDDPGHGCAVPTLGAEIARESPRTRKAFAAKLEQMIDMLAEQIPDVPRKAARKQAMAVLATMMGTLVLARVAGNGEFSDEILAAGRDAVQQNGARLTFCISQGLVYQLYRAVLFCRQFKASGIARRHMRHRHAARFDGGEFEKPFFFEGSQSGQVD